MYRPIRIRQHERGLVFRGGDLARVLPPGRHYVRSWAFGPGRDHVQRIDVLGVKFEHPKLDILVRNASLADALHVVDLADTERAIVLRDGRAAWVLGPGRHAFWKEPYRIEVERYDATKLRLERPRLDAVLGAVGAAQWLAELAVAQDVEVLVYHDGRLAARVTEGRFVHWKGVGRVVAYVVQRREQVLDVAGQEIMTQDKVTLRVNLVVTYRVVDPVRSVETVQDASQALYRDAQLALRAAVGTRPIDALLADKESVGAEVRNALAARAEEFGVAVRAVGLRDIVLPGDMKAILNQVITAQKEAEANLVKRREETAAARSQANTARILAENPVLTRVREFEALQGILQGANVTFVLGQGDLAAQVRALVNEPPRTG